MNLIKLSVLNPMAIKWRGRLAGMCRKLARQTLRMAKATETYEGYLLLANKSGKFINGTIMDPPQHVLLIGQGPPGTGDGADYPHQYISMNDRSWVYQQLKEQLDPEYKGRAMSWCYTTNGSVDQTEDALFISGATKVLGSALAVPELRVDGMDRPAGVAGFFNLDYTDSAKIVTRVIRGGTSLQRHGTDNPVDQKASNTLGVCLPEDVLSGGFRFTRYFRLLNPFIGDTHLLASHWIAHPATHVFEVSGRHSSILTVAATFRDTYPTTTPDIVPDIVGVSGLLLNHTTVAYDEDDSPVVTTVLNEHWDMQSHPQEFMRPVEDVAAAAAWEALDPENHIWYTNIRWTNSINGIACAAYDGGVAVLSLQFHTVRFIRDELLQYYGHIYNNSTTLSRYVVGSGVSHEDVFSSSNDPTLGVDRYLFGSYTSGGAAYFHVLRFISPFPENFDPDLYTHVVPQTNQQLVVYRVDSSGVTEQSLVNCSALGYVAGVIYALGTPTAFIDLCYDDGIGFDTSTGSNSGYNAKYPFNQIRYSSGTAQGAQLDEYRVLFLMKNRAAVVANPFVQSDVTTTAVVYDTRTNQYSVKGTITNNASDAAPTVLAKAILDEDGEEVTPATVMATVARYNVATSAVYISYDSGDTWEIMAPGIANAGGAYFVGNILNVFEQGDPWREQPQPEE